MIMIINNYVNHYDYKSIYEIDISKPQTSWLPILHIISRQQHKHESLVDTFLLSLIAASRFFSFILIGLPSSCPVSICVYFVIKYELSKYLIPQLFSLFCLVLVRQRENNTYVLSGHNNILFLLFVWQSRYLHNAIETGFQPYYRHYYPNQFLQ